MPASEYARSTFGRLEASNLRGAANISSVLAHFNALSATSTFGKSYAIFAASGLYPPLAIDNFPFPMLEQTDGGGPKCFRTF
jgi:hypothetical protein